MPSPCLEYEMSTDLKQTMRDQVLEGRPVSGFDIVDAHCHLGYWHNFHIHRRTADEMVRMMDCCGIRCCISSSHTGISVDYIRGNTEVIQATREFPGRIHAYCCVNPHYPADEIRDELKRCFDAGTIGIKFHPDMHVYPVDGGGYRPAWEYADEHGLVVLCHTAVGSRYNATGMFEGLANQYPNAKILLGHSGFGYEGARQSGELARKCPNVFLDTCSSVADVGLLEMLIAGAGADRVLWATDIPFLDCRPQIGRAAFSELSDDDLRLLLGGNARRLFNL